MDPTPWHLAAITLAGLAVLLVTCTLSALASRLRHERTRHELIRTSRLRRIEYMQSVEHRAG